MNRDGLAEAVAMVQRAGEEPTPYRVLAALRQLGDTETTYQQVFDALQAEAGAGAEEEAEKEADDGPSADEKTPLATIANDAGEAAAQALQQAEQRVRALEAQLPSLEAALEPAREAVLQAMMRLLAAKECRWRGAWPVEDDAVVQALGARR